MKQCSKCKHRAYSYYNDIDYCLGYEMETDEHSDAEECERYEEGKPGCYEDEEYTSSATHGDYSPSNPWDAPGCSISDFVSGVSMF